MACVCARQAKYGEADMQTAVPRVDGVLVCLWQVEHGRDCGEHAGAGAHAGERGGIARAGGGGADWTAGLGGRTAQDSGNAARSLSRPGRHQGVPKGASLPPLEVF